MLAFFSEERTVGLIILCIGLCGLGLKLANMIIATVLN